jgi:uncharacterized glyoxalase superfamily metalloenzyme YdcJ
MSPQFAQPDHIRQLFCSKLSAMYHSEVPLYGTLVSLVDETNESIIANQPGYASEAGKSCVCTSINGSSRQRELVELTRNNEPLTDRLRVERHGAIRLGNPSELSTLRRLFRQLNMFPVNYYDLSLSGVPVHATAFRPVTRHSLDLNPFRIFTSLLRPELISSPEIRSLAENLLREREIYHPETLRLLDKAESEGGLSDPDALSLVTHALLTFKWQSSAPVTSETYNTLSKAHALVADIVAFKGPHINHLTPRTLDIDSVQARMPEKG